MESALSPREIQTRIRSGESIEDVARAAGVPVEQVEPFATPVIAEREHQARMALASPVRRRGETGSNRHLAAVVAERLLSRGIDADAVTWDSWRGDDRIWTVQGCYESGSAPHEALFLFDPKTRFSTAANDEASWLISETSTAHGPQPGRRSPRPEDAEPTVDLRDASALLQASMDAAEMTTPLPHATRASAANAATPVAAESHGSAEPVGTVEIVDVEVIDVEVIEVRQVTEIAVLPSASADPETQADQVEEPTQDELIGHGSVEEFDQDEDEVRSAELGAEPEPFSDDDDLDGTDSDEVPDDRDDYGQDYVDTELEQVDGVYDFVPTQPASSDTLYEMLASLNEDSVNIYSGLTEPTASPEPTPAAEAPQQDESAPAAESPQQIDTTADVSAPVATEPESDPEPPVEPEAAAEPESAPEPPATAPSAPRPTPRPARPRKPAATPKPAATKPAPADSQTAVTKTEQEAPEQEAPEQEALVEDTQVVKPKPRGRKRASVPSWDEIMFGGPRP